MNRLASTKQLIAVVVFATTLLLLFTVAPARAGEDRNFAGSAQFDYLFARHESIQGAQAPGPRTALTGFTAEAALKIAVDISDHLSANFKLCYGCHGFELDMAYFDFRVADELNLRTGRFSPSFGAFNLRHDPANHSFSDKPLPYDMGRMLRRGDWNNGVLPAPFPMTGAEVNGTHWVGSDVQLDYAAYVAAGFKNDSDLHPTDINFQESHLPYYVTANPRPVIGGRIGMNVKLNDVSDATLGVSGMYGTYDARNRLSYAIVGVDIAARVGRATLRAEYLVRRQQVDTSSPGIFKYAIAREHGDFFVKHGAYLELELPAAEPFMVLGRVDALFRQGNVSEAAVGAGGDFVVDSPLTNKATVIRETIGLAYDVERNFRLKLSLETWQFSYADADNHKNDASAHAGVVGSF